MFDPRPYLKELARGKNGARDLTREQSRTLFSAVFAGEVSDVALGALLVAFRVKGETLEELAGMMDALQPHVRPMEMPARRAIPVLVPSFPVLVHGVHQEAARVGTFEILELLGHRCVGSIGEAEDRIESHKLAAVPVGVLSPDLAMLIAVRLETGVRNSAHTLAKLLIPNGVAPNAACRLIAVTHPDFLKLVRDYFTASPANVFLMRGVEGEPMARLHAPQPIEEIKVDSPPVTHLIGEGDVDFPLPARDAAATAHWTREVLAGRERAPLALAREVALIVEHCRTAANARRPGLTLVSSK